MFFGKKPDDAAKGGTPPGDASNAKGKGGGPPVWEPEKAKKFFEHARTVQETGNFEYAMQLWLGGLRFDCTNMEGMQAFFNASSKYLETPESKKGPGKELVRSITVGGDVEKHLRALLEWALKPVDASNAVRAMETAAALSVREPGMWIGERALGAAVRATRPRKDLLLKVAENFVKFNSPDRAVQAAEQALKLDPSDGELGAYVRNLAATATMTKGGYDKPNQEGGFRQSIRDARKQQELDEGDRIVKTEETVDRLIATAEEQYKARPNDMPTIEVLGKRLMERGRGPDEERAYQIFMGAFTQFNQFRFREMAGDIRLRQSARKVRELERMLEKAQGDSMVLGMLDQARKDLLVLERDEYTLRVQAYPTDLTRKFHLGRCQFQLGRDDEAIALFQESQQDAKIRVQSLHFLGQAFFRIRYFDESVQTFRSAIDIGDMSAEMGLELKYWLMLALKEQGKASRNAESLRESDKIASGIMMKQFNYRDIKQQRDEIKALLGVSAGA
jgi:tetratricopeptide (TPR) repeat protein